MCTGTVEQNRVAEGYQVKEETFCGETSYGLYRGETFVESFPTAADAIHASYHQG